MITRNIDYDFYNLPIELIDLPLYFENVFTEYDGSPIFTYQDEKGQGEVRVVEMDKRWWIKCDRIDTDVSFYKLTIREFQKTIERFEIKHDLNLNLKFTEYALHLKRLFQYQNN